MIEINLDNFESRYEFHEWLKEQCHFPSYYGHNLDALYDCLSENPTFTFRIIPSIKYQDYEGKLIQTILDAGCMIEE